MHKDYRKYLQTGAARGAGYALALQQGKFDGGCGYRLGNRIGNSLEFMEHRDYMPGDDLRRLDWGVYARTERLTVKLYREEINPRLDLLIDGSASMALPGTAKAEAVLTLSGFIATAAANAGYQLRTWISKEQIEPVANGSGNAGHWQNIDFTANTSPAENLDRFRGGFQHHGVRIVISDLLWDGIPAHFLSKAGTGAAGLIIIQLLAETDINPPAVGNIRLTDSESGETEELYVDAAAVDKYRTALARHQQNWLRSCRESGTALITMTAETMLKQWDIQPLLAQEVIKAI